MKRTLSFLIFLIGLGFNMSAHNITGSDRCRLVNELQDTHSSIIEKSEDDLLSGIWISGESIENEVNQKLMFEKNGKLLVFNETTDKGIQVEEKKWRLMDFEGGVFLVLSGKSAGKEELYKISQTCDGMELKNINTGKLLSFDYASIKATDVKRSDITGIWTSTQYPFEIAQRFDQPGTFEPIRGAFFDIELSENGNYTKRFGSEIKTFTENGTWSISKDGKYIIFNNKSDKKSSNQPLEALEIHRLNGNKLVARSSITAANLSAFSTGTKSFHFTKKS
ncbi:MAG: hypothetical protein JNK41_00280 [Saprospiraceae bacterium]|nr:hypothetical protein [Saprospiraceae bacterium]